MQSLMQFDRHGWPRDSEAWLCLKRLPETVFRVRVARTFASRLVGLLATTTLAPNEALLLLPGRAVHTLAMKFAIDLVYLDISGRVLGVALNVAPWHFRSGPSGTRAVLEMRANVASDFQVGDVVCWVRR